MNIDIKELLAVVVENSASDLHMVANSEPQIRLDGRLVPLDLPSLDGETIQKMCYTVMTEKHKKDFEENKELDFAFDVSELERRFRANYYVAQGSMAASFRIIPTKIPTLDELSSPAVYKDIIKREKGLILVTGPTGSGKSTTLAAMLNEINSSERKHIVTIEDPVEFTHENKMSLFSYRTVGEDTKSFATALKYAMRQDPDVIFVGELRDKETITAALTAAETGHLVLASLHSNSAAQTINRIIDVFSGDEQPQIRAQLSTTLVAAISQMLIPKLPKGRVCVSEILINTPAIGNLIRESKVHQIYSQMGIGQAQSGMMVQIQELEKLVKSGVITKENALQYANRQDDLKAKLG